MLLPRRLHNMEATARSLLWRCWTLGAREIFVLGNTETGWFTLKLRIQRFQGKASDLFNFKCYRLEFARWFEDVEKLDFEYSGPLPDARPLVFKRKSAEREVKLIILLEDDRLFECEYDGYKVMVKPCHHSNRPPILFAAKHVMEMFNVGFLMY